MKPLQGWRSLNKALLVLIFWTCFLGNINLVLAQSTCSTPTQISGFGVDGDIHANSPASVLGDSWFVLPSFPGPGIGVIGSDSATATPALTASQFNAIIQAGATSQDRNRTYLQRMAFPFLTQINGHTLIDAFAARDFISPDTTAFAGSNKNGDNPGNWTIATSTVPNKNDIIDAGGHLRRSGVDNKLWMFAYVTKLGTSGDSYTDIEIYRQVPQLNLTAGSLVNTGPAATGGHSSFSFLSNGAIASSGDMLICLNYNSTSGIASVKIWCNINNLDGNGNGLAWFNSRPNRPFNLTGDFITGANSNGYGYAEVVSLTGASCLVYSVLNTASAPSGYWGNLSGSGANYSSNLDPEQMVNIAINFTDFGLDGSTATGPCSNVFGALLFKTRSSSSFSSELKDVTGPFEFANFSEVQANAGPDKVLTCSLSSITLNGSSLTPGASVFWTALSGNIVSGANSFTPVVNQAGTYVMSVQSPTIGTCIARDTVVVTLDNTAPAVSAGSDNTVNCSLSTTSLSGSSPIAAATYSWSALSGGVINSGATTPNPIVGAGCYILTVTDPANGCSATDTVCVNADVQAPTISVSSNIPVSCFAGCDGSVEVNATGLSAPFSYLWSNGAAVPNLSGLCADTYTVTVTGSNGCTSNSTITIQQPTAALQIASSSVQNVDCNGSSTGNISVVVAGGTSPYAYQWSNGSTTTSTGSVSAGSYQVTVTDANGCIVNSNSIVVDEPASPVSANASSIASVSCFGGSDGSINVSVSGGTSPYNYQWSNGSISKDLSNVAFGSYTLTVTDANGCTFVLNASVSQPPVPLVASTITATAVTCFGGSDGAAQVLPTGGTAPYGFSWSSGSTAAVANGLSFGSYSVIVTDANGCSAIGNVNVQQPSLLSASAATVQAVSCNGGSNGSINVSVVGGVAPYTYLWSNGSTLEDQSGLSAGSYSLTATDANGCIVNLNQPISEPNAPVSTSLTGSQNISCFGLTDGSINVSVSGGTPGYTYVWSNGSTTSSVLGLAAGTYTVTATDANGCQASNSYTLSQPSAPLSAQQITSSQVSCFGGVDGSIDISVSGGTAPYSFAWSNGATTEDISSISAGVYTVTVTDINGCTSVATSIINEPAAPLSSFVSAVSNVNCQGGSDGSATITVNGGTAPYLYSWSNGANTASTIGLSVGTYSVLITDANGCTLSQSLNISEPLQQLSASASSISNVSCFGGANGSINTSVLGGTAPYSYQWSNGSNSSDINGLSQGAYTVTITDANGCSFVLNTNITQPSAPFSISNNVITSVSCNGGVDGAISLIVVGGTAPYTYNWSNGSSASSVSGLANGSYSVTVTDANGCVLNDSFVINQPAAALSATSNSLIPVSCNGGNDGAINVDVSGGTAPYAFAWSNGANTEDLVNLQSGTYTVTVTDANGCETNLTANIQQPQNPLASSAVVSQQVNCFSGNDGSIDLSVSGGTSPYNYSWNNGAVTEDLSNLSAGTYSVNIIDANGCQDSVSVVVSQPQAPLTLSASGVSGASCFGTSTGVIDLTVNGGTGPYSYSWSNGAVSEDLSGLTAGTYSVTVVDINGCQDTLSVIIDQPQASLAVSTSNIINVDCFGNASGSIDLNVGGGTQPYTYQWSNGSTSEDLSGLSSGSYTVSVVDANGCDGTLTITIQQPSNPLASTVVVTQQVNCFNGSDGSIDLSVSGGTQPYTYAWSNGSITEDLSNLAAGTYTVNIIDANGCLDSVSIAVTQPQDSLAANAVATSNVDCFGNSSGSIDLDVTGGTGPYAYTWSNGSVSQDLTAIATGVYSVTIVDANGCEDTLSIIIDQPLAPLAANVVSSSNVDCFGNATGSIDLNVNGGTQPYTYLWSDGSSNEDLTGLTSGTYTVTVTDANGCETNLTANIQQPQNPLASSAVVSQQVNCFSGNDGSIDLSVSGGTSPYNYSWNNGAVTEDLSNLSAGTYSVNIIDSNGCQDSVSVVVSQPQAPLTLSASGVSGASCFGTSTGVIDLTVNGGTGPYSYSWSNGAVSEDLSGLAAGTYSVTVVDINGCQDTLSVIIDQPQASLAVSASNIINVDCFGNASGSIDLNVGGGTQPYTYQWSNGSTSEDLSGLSSGSYTVSVVDANGCDGTLTITIQQPSNPLASTAVVSQQVNCFNGSDGSIDLSVSGGTQPYTYAWSNGSINEDLTNLSAGTYTVNIIDANGCQDSVSVVVSQPLDSLSSNASVTQQVSCFGGNDGSIDLTINGGTAPYGVAWSNGAITQDISGLAAGTYTVDITDANGCTTSQTVVVQEPVQPLSLQQNTSVQVSCFGGNDGSIDITAFGGTAPYDFQWSNGEITEDVAGLSAGSYTVTITDANGCTLNQSFVINQPTTPLAVSGTTLVGDCINNIGGDINLIVGGGTAPYSYNWSNGATTQNLNNLPSASYTVTVTDANGCIDSANFVIANNSFIYVQITDPEICVGDSALLEVSVNVPSTYQWYYNNTPILGAINDFYFAAVQGFYKCEVNSVCGIIMSDSVEVAVRSVVGATISSNQIICPPDGVELVASGGVSYQWSPSTYLSDPNASNPFANPRETTTYSVLVTDDFGCTITMSVDVTVICDTLLIPNGFSPNGDGVNDGYEIEGIENFPGNILYIYNRWGNLIYKAKDYQNNWTGECNVSGVNYGQKVPAGTYYYILDLNDGQKPRNGFLILRK